MSNCQVPPARHDGARRNALSWRRYLLVPLLLGVTAQACVGNIGDGPPAEPVSVSLEPTRLARLTSAQYRNVLSDLLGAPLPAVPLQQDTNPYLFYSVGATSTPLEELGVQQLEEAAEAITAVIFSDPERREALVGCQPQAVADECVAGFISSFGKRAFRRPLSSEEHARWLGIASTLAEGDAWLGVRMAVAGMLQSPQLLYRVELGETDPQRPDRLRFNAWEMASRLSFVLWNSMPDDELLAAAESGALLTEQGVREQAARLLAHPRA